MTDTIPTNYSESPSTIGYLFRNINRLREHIYTIQGSVISTYPSMIILRQVFLLVDWDRYNDRLSHSIPIESDVDRKHLRHCLNYCFVDRIRDTISNSVIQDQRVVFSNKYTSCPIRVPTSQEAKKAES